MLPARIGDREWIEKRNSRTESREWRERETLVSGEWRDRVWRDNPEGETGYGEITQRERDRRERERSENRIQEEGKRVKNGNTG